MANNKALPIREGETLGGIINALAAGKELRHGEGYLLKLKQIDWKDSKRSAYEATHYARLLATDERRIKLFGQLEPLLEQYKYKKEVELVDTDTRNRFNLYVQVADESI